MATRTYEAVLRGDRLEWTGEEPEHAAPVHVLVILRDEVDPLDDGDEDRGNRMADALESIAQQGGIDIAEWERQRRADKPLAGREE